MKIISDNQGAREMQTTLTQRGQVTLPVVIQRMLNVKPREKVAFQIIDNEIRLVAASFTLESTYGSVLSLKKTEDVDTMIRNAKEEKAKKTMIKLKQV